MKLHLGSNKKILEGYVNVDILDFPGVTTHDLTVFPYPFLDNSVDEIIAHEVLEHISFLKTERVLAEWYRVLAPGGIAHIQVPDIGLMCEYYTNKLICDCVPQKATLGEYKAKEDCFNCSGKALINPKRWSLAFSGAQKHPWDIHLNHFTKENMEAVLEKVGFEDINFYENIYKIVVRARK
jgi:ubiquinone/menaquinone biosynthesis C-methylase UbiE